MQDSIKSLPDYLVSTKNILESEDLFLILQKLLVAILIGLLIGMEREHSKPEGEKTFAGVRTFPLIAVLGFLAALVSEITSPVIYAVAALGLISLVTASHIFAAKEGKAGGTSEISIIIVFMLGSLVFWNFIILAAVAGVIVNLFLTLKIQFHSFVGKINEEDLYATLKLAVITVIILPILPNQTYGPFDVINPRMIWLMVIFISGFSFIGYILIKYFGQNKGISITGLLGGMISSTAVALALSRKSKKTPAISNSSAAGIIIASTVMYLRIFIVVSVLNTSLIAGIWGPMLVFSLSGAAASFFILKKTNKTNRKGDIEFKNPFELRSALLFGLIFGIVIFISKAAEVYFGDSGIYAASSIAGITSVDAIIVSLAELSIGGLQEKTAVAAIILASITNTLVKWVIAFFFGAKEIRRSVSLGLGFIITVSLSYLVYFLIVQ
ncbi:MAG: MgtC/SapB family protein [Ignavibacteriaceae bacterium]